MSLPPRRYDLVGDVLAAAVSRAASGEPLDRSLGASARDEGLALGLEVEGGAAERSLPAVAEVLAGPGFEPQVAEDEVTLRNCPFDPLAQKHTALVCGLNEEFVQGVADGLGRDAVRACLEPEPGRCCVKAGRAERASEDAAHVHVRTGRRPAGAQPFSLARAAAASS